MDQHIQHAALHEFEELQSVLYLLNYIKESESIVDDMLDKIRRRHKDVFMMQHSLHDNHLRTQQVEVLLKDWAAQNICVLECRSKFHMQKVMQTSRYPQELTDEHVACFEAAQMTQQDRCDFISHRECRPASCGGSRAIGAQIG